MAKFHIKVQLTPLHIRPCLSEQTLMSVIPLVPCIPVKGKFVDDCFVGKSCWTNYTGPTVGKHFTSHLQPKTIPKYFRQTEAVRFIMKFDNKIMTSTYNPVTV
jgi:hypothetical protein